MQNEIKARKLRKKQPGSITYVQEKTLGRRRDGKTKEDTKPYRHIGSGPPTKAKPITRVEHRLGDSQVLVDLATQRRGRENISDEAPTKGKEQELDAAEAAGPYVKQQAKESQPGILMEAKGGRSAYWTCSGSNEPRAPRNGTDHRNSGDRPVKGWYQIPK